MNRRKDHIPRVSRKVLPEDELFVTTLEGKRVMKTHWCDYHKEYEPAGRFYYESKTKSKMPHQLRNMCCVGWDLTNGKKNIVAEVSTATLICFFK
jgi:hypothetical protein